MITCRHFVMLHVPKTGGTWVSRSVFPSAPADWNVTLVLPKHNGIDDIAPEHRHLPVVAFVRNPWEWYVSMWAFHQTTFYDAAHNDGSGKWALDLPSEDPARAARWRALAAQGGGFREALPMMVEHENCTRWFETVMGSDPSRLLVGRYERLADDLRAVITRTAGSVPAAVEAAISTAPPIWTSKHAEWLSYYDAASVRLVHEADGQTAERFGYAAPEPRNP